MVKLTIDETYHIAIDKYTYNLRKATGKFDKEGEPLFTTEGYHGTLTGAIKNYARLVMVDKDVEMSLNEFIVEYVGIIDRIEEMFNVDGVKI